MIDQDARDVALSQLVLSIFPGIDLFGTGFEQVGFSVVRGPDPLTGGDIRRFHTVPGRFDGVIGGPPCPDFSRARRCEPSGYGLEMLAEFERVVLEASPTWWLMENVSGVPDVIIPGYSHQRLDINASECGLSQNRLRHFQFGHKHGHVISPVRLPRIADVQPCCVASEGGQMDRRGWLDFCRLQGLNDGIDLSSFTQSGRYRAVGNGVPIPMAITMAQAVALSRPASSVRLCFCGCGREISGRASLANAACRKRMQRRRDSAGVTDQAFVTIEESQL